MPDYSREPYYTDKGGYANNQGYGDYSMNNYQAYSGGGYSRKKSAKKSKVILVIFIIIVLVAGLAVGGYFFFTREKSGNINDKDSIPAMHFYAYKISESTDFAVAYTAAEALSVKGGGGYIYNDGVFNVLVAVYPTEQEALSVVSQNTGGEVLSLNIPQVNISDSSARECIKYLIGDYFDGVYKTAIALESGSATQSAALLSLRNLTAELRRRKTFLFDNYAVRAFYDLADIIVDSYTSVLTMPNLLSAIRNLSIKVVCEYKIAVEAYKNTQG